MIARRLPARPKAATTLAATTPLAMMTPRAALAGAMVAASLCTALMSGPAAAQFLGVGGDPPPRPPSAVPGGRPDAPPAYQAPPSYQQQPSYQSQPQVQPAPPAATQQTTLAPVPLPGRVQSEDLPPPPGAAAVASPPASPALPRPATAAVAAPGQPAPGQLPGQRVPSRADEMTQPPAAKIVNPTAVFSGLDKITGRITAFDAAIGETVQFGALQVTPRACYTRPPTETPLTDGFVEVDEVTLQGEVRRIFTGWMFAASPGLHAVEHAIYDVWLTDCKGGAQTVAEVPPPAAAAPPPTAPAARTAPQPAQQRAPASGAAPQRQAQPPRQSPADAVMQPPLMR
jgi:hypothetical protein